jgi:hypothetical protein
MVEERLFHGLHLLYERAMVGNDSILRTRFCPQNISKRKRIHKRYIEFVTDINVESKYAVTRKTDPSYYVGKT